MNGYLKSNGYKVVHWPETLKKDLARCNSVAMKVPIMANPDILRQTLQALTQILDV